MHFTSYPAVESENQCADHASGILVYSAIYWDILVYTVAYHPTLPCTPKLSTSAYVSDGVTCIHQVPMHIASHPGVNVEKQPLCRPCIRYTYISWYIQVYTGI